MKLLYVAGMPKQSQETSSRLDVSGFKILVEGRLQHVLMRIIFNSEKRVEDKMVTLYHRYCLSISGVSRYFPG